MTQTRSSFREAAGHAWRGIGLSGSPLLADVDPQDLSQWWRTPLGLVVGAIAAIVAMIVVMVILGVLAMVIFGPDKVQAAVPIMQSYMQGTKAPGYGASLAIMAALCLINCPTALLVVLLAGLICKRPFWANFTAVGTWRWRQLGIGLALNMLFLTPVVVFDVLRGGAQAKFPLFNFAHTPVEQLIFLVTAVVCLVLAAGAEELAFRGWLMRQSAGLVRFTWIFLPLNAVLFSAAHGDFDPNAFLDRAFAGLSLGYMALRLGGIEYSTGAHAANNLLIVLFLEPLSLVTPPPMPFDIMSLVEGAAGLALSIAGVELCLRWPVIRRWMEPFGAREDLV